MLFLPSPYVNLLRDKLSTTDDSFSKTDDSFSTTDDSFSITDDSFSITDDSFLTTEKREKKKKTEKRIPSFKKVAL
jgi:hypothetical protein